MCTRPCCAHSKPSFDVHAAMLREHFDKDLAAKSTPVPEGGVALTYEPFGKELSEGKAARYEYWPSVWRI